MLPPVLAASCSRCVSLNLTGRLTQPKTALQLFDLHDFSSAQRVSWCVFVWISNIFCVSIPSDCNPGAYGMSGALTQVIHWLRDWLSCLRTGAINLSSPLPTCWCWISIKPLIGHPEFDSTESKLPYPVGIPKELWRLMSFAIHKLGCLGSWLCLFNVTVSSSLKRPDRITVYIYSSQVSPMNIKILFKMRIKLSLKTYENSSDGLLI